MRIVIEPYEPWHLDRLIELSLRAWRPVFVALEAAMDNEVFHLLHPNWCDDQTKTVEMACTAPESHTWMARDLDSGDIMGFVVLKHHREPLLGEIYLIAVDPNYQGKGVGTSLVQFALDEMKRWGMEVAMVETGGDLGHGPARGLYEKAGFRMLPIARYFKKI